MLYFCLFFVISLLISQEKKNEVKNFFSEEIIKEVKEKGIIEHLINSNDTEGYYLAPNSEIGKIYTNYWQLNKDTLPTYAIETLCYYKKRNPENSIKKCAEILQMNSTMQGISYYSNTRKKDEVLYKQAGTFKSRENKKIIPDEIQENPNGKIGFLYLKDNSLGDIYNIVTYYMRDREVAFRTSNINSLYFGFFKVINPENMNISIIINDFDDEIFMYMMVESNNIRFDLLDEYFSQSFSARTTAVYNWFIKMYESYE